MRAIAASINMTESNYNYLIVAITVVLVVKILVDGVERILPLLQQEETSKYKDDYIDRVQKKKKGNTFDSEPKICILYDGYTSEDLYKNLFKKLSDKELTGTHFFVIPDIAIPDRPDTEACEDRITRCNYVIIIVPRDVSVMLKSTSEGCVFPHELNCVSNLLKNKNKQMIYVCYEGSSYKKLTDAIEICEDVTVKDTISFIKDKRIHHYQDVTLADSSSFADMVRSLKESIMCNKNKCTEIINETSQA